MPSSCASLVLPSILLTAILHLILCLSPPSDEDAHPPRPHPHLVRIPDEQRLLRKILRHYDNSVRPVYETNQTVVVNFSLTLVQIMDMVSAHLC